MVYEDLNNFKFPMSEEHIQAMEKLKKEIENVRLKYPISEEIDEEVDYTENVPYYTTESRTIVIPVILIRVLLIALVFIVVSAVRYCCWLCKRKHTSTANAPLRNHNSRPQPMSVSVPVQDPTQSTDRTASSAPPIIRPIIGGRRTSAHNLRNSASVVSLGPIANDRLTEALVARDRYGMNSMAFQPWNRGGVGMGWEGDGAAIRAPLIEDDRLELGIRAIGGNTELTRDPPHRDRTVGNNDNGDLALLTHLMALDIIYHSDNNNNTSGNNATNEKPPDYEQCLLDLAVNAKLTDTRDDLPPPTYDAICDGELPHQPTAPTIVSSSTDMRQHQTSATVNGNDHVV